MTRQEAAGTSSHATGDLLLASALMAVGIPLEPRNECSVIHKDDGKSYGRFHILPLSACGKFETLKLMGEWSTKGTLLPSHPFVWILDFIAARPQGVSSVSDWLNWAHVYAGQVGISKIGLPKSIGDIPAFVAKNSENLAGHLFAFVHCRGAAQEAFRQAKNQVMMTNRTGGAAIIDASLPIATRNNLLARLEG